ncbi:hypothetical protein M5X06_00125 [Paenibacillus alvei]|uniref:Uncharacterized protein n=1 Tax=Paenibacillus alvei TaxID=44250 RepID=A0ABT4GVA0_PAEAL|nr:hypothetical protein [Paenibacillus alvei]MCY9760627.1 hypothetical protein [Paenibacillus alvei]MCY9765241.1 hypothetical protein [Paenibacillus alvei]NEZ44376.1 hypothetical protein [Paenibacillus alvei]
MSEKMNDLVEKFRGKIIKIVMKIKPDNTVTAVGEFNKEGFEKAKKARMDASNVFYRTPPKTDGAVVILGEVNDPEHFAEMITTNKESE